MFKLGCEFVSLKNCQICQDWVLILAKDCRISTYLDVPIQSVFIIVPASWSSQMFVTVKPGQESRFPEYRIITLVITTCCLMLCSLAMLFGKVIGSPQEEECSVSKGAHVIQLLLELFLLSFRFFI